MSAVGCHHLNLHLDVVLSIRRRLIYLIGLGGESNVGTFCCAADRTMFSIWLDDVSEKTFRTAVSVVPTFCVSQTSAGELMESHVLRLSCYYVTMLRSLLTCCPTYSERTRNHNYISSEVRCKNSFITPGVLHLRPSLPCISCLSLMPQPRAGVSECEDKPL